MDTWYMLLALVMGAGAGLAVYSFGRIWFGGKVSRHFREWHAELERAFMAMVMADLAAAETKAYLFDLIGKIPHDFDPVVFLATNAGIGVQRSVLFEAERRGIVSQGTFERVFGVPLRAVSASQPPPAITLSRPIGIVRR